MNSKIFFATLLLILTIPIAVSSVCRQTELEYNWCIGSYGDADENLTMNVGNFNSISLNNLTMFGNINMNNNSIINTHWINATYTNISINYTQLTDEHWVNETREEGNLELDGNLNVTGYINNLNLTELNTSANIWTLDPIWNEVYRLNDAGDEVMLGLGVENPSYSIHINATQPEIALQSKFEGNNEYIIFRDLNTPYWTIGHDGLTNAFRFSYYNTGIWEKDTVLNVTNEGHIYTKGNISSDKDFGIFVGTPLTGISPLKVTSTGAYGNYQIYATRKNYPDQRIGFYYEFSTPTFVNTAGSLGVEFDWLLGQSSHYIDLRIGSAGRRAGEFTMQDGAVAGDPYTIKIDPLNAQFDLFNDTNTNGNAEINLGFDEKDMFNIKSNVTIHRNMTVLGNISMKSPDGTLWNCGVGNDGTFSCS